MTDNLETNMVGFVDQFEAEDGIFYTASVSFGNESWMKTNLKTIEDCFHELYKKSLIYNKPISYVYTYFPGDTKSIIITEDYEKYISEK